jgi:UPF0755 protein
MKSAALIPRSLVRLARALSVAGLLVVAACVGWALTPLTLQTSPLDFSVRPGSTARSAAAQIRAQGVDLSPRLFYLLARLSGEGAHLEAGSYEVEQGISPWSLLNKLARGDQSLLPLSVPEGWRLAQLRAALADAPDLVHDTQDLSDDALMQRLGEAPGSAAEGQFLPDTYLYGRGSSELALLARAHRAMQRALAQAWPDRDAGLPLHDPEQALILASMVEKETGMAQDRERIAEVFVNRLHVGMPLQSDPTVIYGLGARYRGSLGHDDLRTDSPYNTYVHTGLPPTPIALPGLAALQAVLHPAPGHDLYFVARGDGSSAFSSTLAEHNAAVERYILKKAP